MFVRQHQNQFRIAQADVQRYFGGFNVTSNFAWNKPVGVSFIYMLLVGGGGAGDGFTVGGGTGAVTVWMGNASHVPNSLRIKINITSTDIIYQSSASSGTTLLTANGGSQISSAGGAATAANTFASSGFYSNIAGDTGVSGAASASSTTFLSIGGTSGNPASNYGYSGGGSLYLSPILVSTGSLYGTAGAGSGMNSTGTYPGPGFALIASW